MKKKEDILGKDAKDTRFQEHRQDVPQEPVSPGPCGDPTGARNYGSFHYRRSRRRRSEQSDSKNPPKRLAAHRRIRSPMTGSLNRYPPDARFSPKCAEPCKRAMGQPPPAGEKRPLPESCCVPIQQFSFWQDRHVGAASEPRKFVARCHSHRMLTPDLPHNENC